MKQGKRVQKKEKTKQAILKAALELFAAKGFYATTRLFSICWSGWENSHQTRALHARAGVIAGEKPCDRIGHYKLLQQIGEGGCGVVFMAEQEEPMRRRVALKIIKPGMDTKSVIARFEAERQTLARMPRPWGFLWPQ